MSSQITISRSRCQSSGYTSGRPAIFHTKRRYRSLSNGAGGGRAAGGARGTAPGRGPVRLPRARRRPPESDWDLLVLAEGLPERLFDRHLFIKQRLPPGCRGAVSILARTPEEFESWLASLYLDIALDGQILCDPRGYATERLAAVRQIIEDAGLYRVRTPAGDVWRWKKEPSGPWVLEWKK